MSIPINEANIDRIKLTPPIPNLGLPPKADQRMRFAKIGYPAKPPKFSLNAKVVEVDFAQEEFGGGLFIKVKPEFKDLDKIQKIDELLEGDDSEKFRGQMGFDGGYEHRSSTDDMDTLRLKLKMKDGTFNFECPWTTEDEVVEKVECGQKLTAIVSCGFYFSEEKKTYGVYWQLKSLEPYVEGVKTLPKKLVKKTKKEVVIFGKKDNV